METGCRIHSAREGTTALTKLAREGLFAAEICVAFWLEKISGPHKLMLCHCCLMQNSWNFKHYIHTKKQVFRSVSPHTVQQWRCFSLSDTLWIFPACIDWDPRLSFCLRWAQTGTDYVFLHNIHIYIYFLYKLIYIYIIIEIFKLEYAYIIIYIYILFIYIIIYI